MNNIGSRKSLDLYREVWINLAQNQRYSEFVCEKDIETFRKRFEHEGLTFLTCILPRLGKALDAFHSSKEWIPPTNFSLDDEGHPIFLQGAIKLALRGNSLAVDCVRQLSYAFYKLEVTYDSGIVAGFLDNFEKVDQEVGAFIVDEQSPTIQAARSFIARVLCNEDPHDIRPCHGSGSTACRTVNYEKYHLLRYYPKLDDYFSYPEYFFYSSTHLADEYQKLANATEASPTARICLVPKDSRGPRVISCEPAELMYIQQGLMRKLYAVIETHKLTRGHVNFTDQGINQALARESSIDGQYATLDLTDASDRVSLQLVRALFPANWFAAFEACRSECTILPNGKSVKLNKFAPMGSSCCFPVEALVFWAIACASTRGVVKDIFVYGDDIIVKADKALTVIDALESVGLLVNRNKTYIDGPFRESCGGEYHNGYDVTPVRFRKAINASNSSITTDADLANLLIAKFGYSGTIFNILDLIDREYGIPLPRSLMPHPACILADPRASNDIFYQRRWNIDLQRYEYRIRSVSARICIRSEATWSELLRKELTRESERDVPDKYANPLAKLEVALKPGYYADVHSAQKKWTWSWLG